MYNLIVSYNPLAKSANYKALRDKYVVLQQEQSEERIEDFISKVYDYIYTYKNDSIEIRFSGTISDFNKLKDAILQRCACRLIHEKITKEIDQRLEDLNALYEEIQNSPFPIAKESQDEFDDDDLYSIYVVSNMSSGKSTLINALIGKKLLPVFNTATTATIVRVINSDQENFKAIAYDSDGKRLYIDEDVDYSKMKEWNTDNSIFAIDIYGRIPFAKGLNRPIAIVDTPGPRNKNHEQMTYQMLNDSDKSLVLFVMNGTNLNVNDEATFMDYVCNCMKERGKQSRDRYIFAINKMDAFDPKDDDIPGTLRQAKELLEERGIIFPNIYPISAQVALECRTNPILHFVLDSFKDALNCFDEMKLDSYYEFNNLPHSSKREIEHFLADATEEEKAEIHSGIVSVEEAILRYFNMAEIDVSSEIVHRSYRLLDHLWAMEHKIESQLSNTDNFHRNGLLDHIWKIGHKGEFHLSNTDNSGEFNQMLTANLHWLQHVIKKTSALLD